MTTLAINRLHYYPRRKSLLARIWCYLTFHPPEKTTYVITDIEFSSRKEIKVGKRFLINDVQFLSLNAKFDKIFDHLWHIEAIALTVTKKKPKKFDFSYSTITKIYGEEPVLE